MAQERNTPADDPAYNPAYNPADPQTRKTNETNPPDGKKTVSVTYRPVDGEPETVEAYGKTFRSGEAQDIDIRYADKARGNPMFEVQGERTYGDDRETETRQEEEDEDMSFDDNVAANRLEEYGTDDPIEADRIRRARESNAELAAARSSPDRDPEAPRRRGRPKKKPDLEGGNGEA